MKKTTLDLGAYKPILTAQGVGVWKYEKKLPLKTDGFLRLIPLGVGAAFSTTMFQSNFIVVKGETVLFLDLGTKTTLKMAEFGLSVHDVKNIMITHSHADHVGSLEELALKKRYEAPFMAVQKKDGEEMGEYMARVIEKRMSGKLRPNLYIPYNYAQVLWGSTLRGGLAFSEEIDLCGPKGEMLMAHFFNVIHPKKLDGNGVDSWEFYVGEGADTIHVQTFVTKHIPDVASRVTECMYSVGMVIDGRLYISGDTRFDEQAIMRFGASCEMLLQDCQHFPGGVHGFYGELKTLPPGVKGKMYPYHLTDGMQSIDVTKDGFPGLLEPAPTFYDFY